ncbi:MAG: hypothetical protein M1831_001192 [Alyxoria varia]|nr:MAG: hypothetical protein M1831_001192 [Alyxoria varia]
MNGSTAAMELEPDIIGAQRSRSFLEDRPELHQQEDEDFEGDVFADEPEGTEKDETELELEKLVFGDSSGFREELKAFQKPQTSSSREIALREGDEDEEQEAQLQGVADADLFFLDDGPSDQQPNLSQALQPIAQEDETHSDYRGATPPAWEDSDDDRYSISLMAVPRLRKLRNFEGEDVVSGREYSRRLRRQFERLHPRPEWAQRKDSAQQPPRKRRRRGSASNSASDEEVSEVEVDMDGENNELSTQPLPELLRSTQQLTRTSNKNHGRRKKPLVLRPEVIAMERMRDIQPTQPHAIISLSIHPTLPLLISTGLSSTLYLHHLNPHPPPPDTPNPLLTSLKVKNASLTCSAFSPLPAPNSSSGAAKSDLQHHPKIYLSSSSRPYFHTWTLPTGGIPRVPFVSGQNKTTQRSIPAIKPSPCGRYLALKGSSKKGGGVVNILDATTSQWIAQAKGEGRKGVADFVWWGDGEGLCVVSTEGEVVEWSLQERSVVWRWVDEGQVGATVVAMGGRAADTEGADELKSSKPKQVKMTVEDEHDDDNAIPNKQIYLGPDRYIAIGSTAGIVNMYARPALTHLANHPPPNPPTPTAQPKPTHTITNLPLPITSLAFSPDPQAQLLVLASVFKKDAMKLVHTPSGSVYRNWPTSKTPLGRVSAVAVGEITIPGIAGDEPERRMVMCVGDKKGVLRGWEICG